MFICVTRIHQQHIRRIFVHIFFKNVATNLAAIDLE